MNMLYKISIISTCLAIIGCGGTRIIYKDNYFPVPYAAKLTLCPQPIFKVSTLLPEKAIVDGIYVQNHIADDRAVQGYGECNAKIIELYNEAATVQNKKTLEKLPQEVINTLPPNVKKVLSENQ